MADRGQQSGETPERAGMHIQRCNIYRYIYDLTVVCWIEKPVKANIRRILSITPVCLRHLLSMCCNGYVLALTQVLAKLSMQPESSDGFASVGTILPKEKAAQLPGGLFVSAWQR
jgi:hypothetical protein